MTVTRSDIARIPPSPERNLPFRKRVLVVDDDADVREVTRLLLETEGYEVDEAQDGLEAFYVCMSDHFDVVVTDGNMPRLDGPGLVRCLRRSGCKVPIVMNSAMLRDHVLDPEVARELSAALVKPVPANRFLDAVARASCQGTLAAA